MPARAPARRPSHHRVASAASSCASSAARLISGGRAGLTLGEALPPYPEALRCAALTHAALTVGKGTPQEAMDGLLKDWTEVFKEDGKIKP